MVEISVITFVVGSAVIMLLLAMSFVVRDVAAKRRREQQDRRLFGGPREPMIGKLQRPNDDGPVTSVSGKMVQWTDRIASETGYQLQGTDARLFVLLFATAFAGPVLLLLESPVWAVIAFMVGGLAPLLFFLYRGRARLQLMASQLPDALYLLARAVRAGESPDQAIAMVAHETAAPLGTEFTRCHKQLDMGLSMPAAMRAMARRTRLFDLRLFATTIMLHRQTGGNIATTLERLADVMRNRLEYRRQFKASTAGGRLAMFVIATSATATFLSIFFWRPAYVDEMLAKPLGWALLAGAVTMQVCGLIWIAMLLKTDY